MAEEGSWGCVGLLLGGGGQLGSVQVGVGDAAGALGRGLLLRQYVTDRRDRSTEH